MKINRCSLFLFIFLSLALPAMEKPPALQKTEEKMKITQQELAQEAKRLESYLSLLPSDVIKMVQEYTSVTRAIQSIRESDYFKQLQKRITDLLTYPNHYWDQNLREEREKIEAEIIKIIKSLFTKYESEGIDEFTIALLLNVYPSFAMAFLSPSADAKEKWAELRDRDMEEILRGRFLDVARVFSILKKYINESTLNYQSLIDYVADFIINYGRTKQYDFPSFNYTHYGIAKRNEEQRKIIIILLDMFEDELKNSRQMPELKILLDTGQDHFIKELLCESPRDLLKNPLVLRYLRKRNLSAATSHLIQFQQEFTHSWFDTFLKYLETSDIHAALMFNSADIYYCSNALLRTLLIEKAGMKLFDYSFNKYELNLSSGSPYQDEFYVSLLEYLFKHDNQATANLILNQRIKDYIKSDLSADPYWQKEQKEYGMRLLIALIQSPAVDATFLKELLDRVSIFNSADSEGITVLMHIIQNGQYDVANFLLEQPDININACDHNGHNALSYAQLLPPSKERDALIAALIEHGAQEEGTCVIQ